MFLNKNCTVYGWTSPLLCISSIYCFLSGWQTASFTGWNQFPLAYGKVQLLYHFHFQNMSETTTKGLTLVAYKRGRATKLIFSIFLWYNSSLRTRNSLIYNFCWILEQEREISFDLESMSNIGNCATKPWKDTEKALLLKKQQFQSGVFSHSALLPRIIQV